MFTSKQHLHNNLGVDQEIAAFFVDRKLPENNSYWAGRYLYVATGTGYLFIPLFFDLQFKCGIPKDKVLDETYVQIAEAVLNSAAMHELEKITFDEHIENCKSILHGKIKNQVLYADLCAYFVSEELRPYKYLGTFSKALNRADSFLFSLCCLEANDNVIQKIIQEWYALIPSFLLMDDITDLKEDQQQNQENSIRDFGEGKKGVESALEFLRVKFGFLRSANNKLGEYFERSLDLKLQTPYLKSILN